MSGQFLRRIIGSLTVILILSLLPIPVVSAQEPTEPQTLEQERPRETAQPRGRGRGQRGPGQARGSRPGGRTAGQAPTESASAPENRTASSAQPTLPQEWADQVPWRSIGPANMSGRVIALAVVPNNPTTWWAATASGGLLKTTNNGITFEHQFDKQTTVSIGDVQVAPSNRDILWVGTGEHNPRNSASWGDGVYKSVDGGKTWTNMGLKESFQIGRIAIHPENPDIVWVGALGRLWGPNKERGLFKTTDGGQTWKKVLYVNEDTGVIDVKLNPSNPDEMLVATYQRRRGLIDENDPIVRFGEGSSVYRSTDGGESFTKSIEGLPTCKLGRIGFDYFQADPKYVVAVVESEKVGQLPEKWGFLGVRGENADVGARLTNVTSESPADKAGLKVGDIVVLVDGELATDYAAVLAQVRRKEAGQKLSLVYIRDRKKMETEVELVPAPEGQAGNNPFAGELGGQSPNLQDQQGSAGAQHGGVYLSEDGGVHWKRINSINPRPMYFSHVRFDPQDRNNMYICGVSLYRSSDGGKTFQGDGGRNVHADHQALWINPANPHHMILGTDGGVYVTYDRMDHWDHLNHVAIGQFYHVGVDSRRDYNVYGGLQDNGSWGGPSRGKYGEGPVNTDWFRVGGGDGFVTLADPDDPDQIYFESQNGFMGRIHLTTGERGSIQPRERGQQFRFNWKTPFILSPHNSKTHYSAGNFVFRSVKKGDAAKRISPEITNTSQGSGTAISESPVEEGLLYVGTTDGAVWMTRDGGKEWQPLFYQPEPKPKTDAEAETKADEAAEAKQEEAKREDQSLKDVAVPKTEDAPKTEQKEAKPADPLPSENPDDPVSGTWKGTIEQEGLTEGVFEFTITLKKASDNGISGSVDSPLGELPISSGSFDPAKKQVEINVQSDQVAFVITGVIENNEMKGRTEVANAETVIEFVATRIKPESEEKPQEAAQEKAEKATEVKVPEPSPVQDKAESKPEPQTPPADAEKSEAEKSKEESNQEAVPTKVEDPVSGKWTGTFVSERGEQEVSLTMKMNTSNQVTGSFESPRGERQFTGKFNPATKVLTLATESDQFEMSFDGKVENEQFTGDVDIGGGRFSMSFEFKRDSKSSTPAEEKKIDVPPTSAETSPTNVQSPTGEKSLAKLLPGPRWVSSIEASRFRGGRCYITFDGHRSNDDGVYVFVTNDYGKTWESLKSNLPDTAGSVHVLREDIRNENLLYLGCEFSAWFSIDGGKSWTQIKGKFPTVAVHEFAVHPTAGELVAATHGRSLWIADVNHLRQFSEATVKADMYLYQPKEVILWRTQPSRGDYGPRRFVGENPSRNANLAYSLGRNATSVSLVIKDLRGQVIKTFTAPTTAGLHSIDWGLDADRRAGAAGPGRFGGGPGAGGPGGGGGGGFRFGNRVSAGDYLVVLEVDGKQESRTISIKNETP